MIKLYNKLSGQYLGEITASQFQYLQQHLVAESVQDTDYFIRRDTLERFEREGADKSLVQLLRGAMGEDKDIEVQWARPMASARAT
jgi:hypothetical protein